MERGEDIDGEEREDEHVSLVSVADAAEGVCVAKCVLASMFVFVFMFMFVLVFVFVGESRSIAADMPFGPLEPCGPCCPCITSSLARAAVDGSTPIVSVPSGPEAAVIVAVVSAPPVVAAVAVAVAVAAVDRAKGWA